MSIPVTDLPAVATDPYLRRFDKFESGALSPYPSWVTRLRKAAISHFVELGFPTLDDEEWRFTNLGPIHAMTPRFDPPAPSLTMAQVAPFLFGGMPSHRLVFLDGQFVPEVSAVGALLPGVHVEPLRSALAWPDGFLATHLARQARFETHAFVALNTALFLDGLCVVVPPGRTVELPIHALFLDSGAHAGLSVHPRNFIRVGAGGQARVIEQYASLGSAPALTNAVTELVVDEAAVLEHARIQRQHTALCHVASVQALLERKARFTSHSVSLGARLSRNDIGLVLNGEGIDAVLNGLYLARGEQLVDHHTVADHTQPRCQSHEFYHGLLDGRARGVFNGKIFVRKAAQKTDAKQTNRTLLLSPEATIDTKPQLEIFADDVKCTHGATVGQLNDEAIFYLRSRGIGLHAARQMLLHAFAADILGRVSQEPVRLELERRLAAWLAEGAGR
jgi:Fe-S cluster assembly protein SufD